VGNKIIFIAQIQPYPHKSIDTLANKIQEEEEEEAAAFNVDLDCTESTEIQM